MPSKKDHTAALEISPLFYDAVLAPERWPSVLGRLAAEFDARVAALNIVRASEATVLATYSWGASRTLEERYLALKDITVDDPRSRSIPEVLNRPFHCRELVSAQAWHASSFYRKVLAPLGVDDNVGVLVAEEIDDVGIGMAFFRAADAAPYGPRDLERMQLYVPHLRQASRLLARRYAAATGSHALARALDRVDLATAVVDRFSAIQFANTGARALMDGGDAVRSGAGRLEAVDRTAGKALAETVFRIATAAPHGQSLRSEHVLLPRGDGRPGLHATVSPLTSPAGEDGTALLWAAVYLLDPARAYETTAEQLQRTFGLTLAEAEVLRAFVAGADLRTIAQETGRAYETVRSHLKSVMDKVGVTRQTELMRLVATTLPSLRGR